MTCRRARCITAALLATTLLVAVVAWYWSSTSDLRPWQFLAHVVQLEQRGIDPGTVQPLGWSLAILGRDDEVRALEFFQPVAQAPAAVAYDQLPLEAVPWQAAIEQIAAQHRIVMIMEDHCASKHREFIGATLATFRQAGFTHYAAEGIGPLDRSLVERGFPISRTGLYTSDPAFGNTLRQAIGLGFTVFGYDFRPTSHDAREEYAATQIASRIRRDANARLVVHAGHAHVLKHPTQFGERWLAARLWEKTGMEPFTIWQWSSTGGAGDYAEVVRVLSDRGISVDEPVLLMPPPPLDCGLRDSPYGLAGVDAIVLHPPDQSAAPAQRTVLFPDRMQRIDGRWNTPCWPVVVSAYRRGEPIDAVPLDQVMLRQGESRFRLWIPADAEYQLRVFNSDGLVDAQSAGLFP